MGDASTRLDASCEGGRSQDQRYAWDTAAEDSERYLAPLGEGNECSKLFAVNTVSGQTQAEDDSDAAIKADMGFTSTDSQTNLVFMNLKRPAAGLREACRDAGVMVGRDVPPYEKTHCRISIGTMDEMKRAVDVFKKVLGNSTSTAAKDGI